MHAFLLSEAGLPYLQLRPTAETGF